MTKITDYLATVTDVNSVFPAVGPAVPNSERCVIKDETGETAGSVGALNHWQIDPTANPLVTYTNPRLPRWQDLVPLITTTTTTTILNCNFTFSTLQVPVASTTTTTTSTSTSTTTTTTTLPLNEWYILYNCSNGQSYNSAEYATNTFELNDRVTSGGVFYYVTGIINYNPGGTLLSITAVAGQTFCPPVPPTTTTTTTINCPNPLTIDMINVTGPQYVPRGSTQNYTFTSAGSLATFPQTYTITASGTFTPFTPVVWIRNSSADPITLVIPIRWQNGASTQNSVDLNAVNCGVYNSTYGLQVTTY